MFHLVHSITDNTWAVAEATRDVIRDFAADGVVYLELRTTPREVPGRMSREAYCRAVLDVLTEEEKQLRSQQLSSQQLGESSGSSRERILVRLLLAVDRRKLEDMEDTVQLFFKLRQVTSGFCGAVTGSIKGRSPREKVRCRH
jgi:adenosine deaminase